MATTKATSLIVDIVRAGGGVIIDADKAGSQLVEIAAAASKSDATVIVKNAHKKATSQLVAIAVAGKGKVIFDLTKP